jgi:hypothetical protein
MDEMVFDHGRFDDRHRILLPVPRIHAGIGLGIISLLFLAITIFARYSRHLTGAWRWICAIGAAICLYFNLFVLVVQLFEKVPALHAMTPTQTESPFKLTQLGVLAISAVLALNSFPARGAPGHKLSDKMHLTAIRRR